LKRTLLALLIAAGLTVLFACGVLWIALSYILQDGSEFAVGEGIAALWGMPFVAVFAVLAVFACVKRALLIAAGPAVLVACFMLCAALEHNPQGEFYGSELGVNWEGVAAIWVSWFVVVFVVFAVLAWVIYLFSARNNNDFLRKEPALKANEISGKSAENRNQPPIEQTLK